ncbi:MAG TPA: asparagine synthase (glutamine-hydrolyzing) [Gemmatimonadaceae bacterium]|nr:asparagine synthase (glutamine-hydrolyzing) [Gemmatimonadaceae bacterium]
MCGIAGIARSTPSGVTVETLGRMAAALQHRGPDGYGFYTGSYVGFAHNRLSIVDVAGGGQPLANEDGQVVVTYNGEIYNHPELRRELEARGHVFRTRSDTEVLVHAYEEWGAAMLHRLNGQFAFAIHDAARRTVFLARDRFGVRPLFYAQSGRALYFASEVKALFASGEVSAAMDPRGLDEVFTFWAARPPRTPFRDVRSLEPGTYGIWRDGSLHLHRYYDLAYPEQRAEPRDALEQLTGLMETATSLRMRADVPVGAYLSGGLDSSITASLAARMTPHQLRTFSITFSDSRFDESEFQRAVAGGIGSLHGISAIGENVIAQSFPEVVWHAETPLLRTAPAPMYHLAKLTKASGIKVVLTGEGADELFLGYDLFKEVAVRRFCLRRPESRGRQRLFDRLYPYLFEQGRGGEFWRKFFLDAGRPDDPLFSHLPRILLTSRIKEFYAPEFAASLTTARPMDELRESLPARFFQWSPLNQAAYLEMELLLSPYLLSSQGDRMAMAHGVEGRYPFLDHRLFEFAAALPTSSRLLGLREKEILRRFARRILPASISGRRKQPYRAPDAPSFFAAGAPGYIADMLSEEALNRVGVWAPRAVGGLVRRCRAGSAISFRENQALLAVLSTQLWHHQFVATAASSQALPTHAADVVMHEAVPVPA